jgi:hypothetical protein
MSKKFDPPPVLSIAAIARAYRATPQRVGYMLKTYKLHPDDFLNIDRLHAFALENMSDSPFRRSIGNLETQVQILRHIHAEILADDFIRKTKKKTCQNPLKS